MCSIEEAWGNITFSQNKSGVTNTLIQQQMSMNQERQPDVNGQLYTQSDDRRQWSTPETNVYYDDFNKGLMAKPAQEANGLSRGVHSKYSREKRFESNTETNRSVLGPLTKLSTDVDPKYYERTQPTNNVNQPPEYLEVYKKPFTELNSVGIPLPANCNGEQFMEIKQHPDIGDKFTPELITDPVILAEANNVNHTVKQDNLSTHLCSVGNSEKPVDTDITSLANNKVNMMTNQLKALMTKVNYLEKKITTLEHDKSHDIVLFIVLAIFIVFILDNVFNKKVFN